MIDHIELLSAPGGIPGGKWPTLPYQGESAAGDPVFWVTVVFVVTALFVVFWRTAEEDERSFIRDRLATMVVTFSARVAGHKRDHLLDDWLADLAGTPEEGRPLSSPQRFRYGRRCLWAAVRLRSGDVIDDTLGSNARCALAAGLPVAAAGLVLLRDGGLTSLVTHAQDLGYLAGLGLLSIKWARKRRGITSKTVQRSEDRDG
jgi:hypothetical protein